MTYKEGLGRLFSIRGCAGVPRLKVRHGVHDGVHDGLQGRNARRPTVQHQKCGVAPPGQGDEDVVSSGEQYGDGHVDKAEDAGSVADVFTQLKPARHEVDVGLEAAKRNGTQHDVENDIERDRDAENPSWSIAQLTW